VQDSQDLLEVRHVSVSINRPLHEVYEFVSDVENLPTWAAGLCTSVRKAGNEWIATGTLGEVKVRFAERNGFGVLDHDVVLEHGVTVHNPIRVVPNGTGSELTFTLFRQPGISDGEFADDAKAVEKDLGTLKALLE